MGTLPFVNILGTNVTVTDPASALALVERNHTKWRGRYIVACNVHAVVTALDNAAFCAAENEAVLALPDGKPLTIVQRRNGHPDAGHVPITALMESILSVSPSRGYRHYFYGSTEETQALLQERLQQRYPGIQIVGSKPSVFRPLTTEEKESLYADINAAAPDFLWVGLGVPRQELFMSEAAERVHALMLGVGGGFDVLCGNVQRAPVWMQRMCLEWLYRLLQEPKRLFRRYFITNTRFLWLLVKERRK